MTEQGARGEIGLRFVRAIASKDSEALTSLFDPQVDFRGLTPKQTWQATNPAEVVEIVFGSWFEPGDVVQETLEAETEPIVGRARVRYRFRVESEGAPHLVEQQGYYDEVDGRITRMTLVCSGFQPWPG